MNPKQAPHYPLFSSATNPDLLFLYHIFVPDPQQYLTIFNFNLFKVSFSVSEPLFYRSLNLPIIPSETEHSLGKLSYPLLNL